MSLIETTAPAKPKGKPPGRETITLTTFVRFFWVHVRRKTFGNGAFAEATTTTVKASTLVVDGGHNRGRGNGGGHCFFKRPNYLAGRARIFFTRLAPEAPIRPHGRLPLICIGVVSHGDFVELLEARDLLPTFK
jgi:hypothetical protein